MPAVKQIALPDGTRRFFGRRAPVVEHPRLKLSNYMLASLPAPPPAAGYMRSALPAIRQMYLNDQLGDCVEACFAHAVGVFVANAAAGARQAVYDDAQITSLYSAWGGYVPGDPSTDQGTDMQTALAAAQKTGIPGPWGLHQIAGSLVVNPSNLLECQTAIWLFEDLLLGLNLPDAWVNPAPVHNGFVWDIAGRPDPNNGHCVLATNYDAHNIYISTWGMNGVMTNHALAEYCAKSAGGELYTMLSHDVIARGMQKAPNGFAWSALKADFEALS